MSRQPAKCMGWLATTPASAGDPAEADHDVRREGGVDLQERVFVQDGLDDPVDVVRLVRRVGDEGVEFLVVRADLVVRRDGDQRRLVEVVRRQVGQQVPGEGDAVLLVFRLVVRDTRLGRVGVRPAELLEGHVLARHGLDHVGAGDEHVAGALDHQREVGDRRGVHGPARGRPHDQADLRDHAGGAGVAEEDLREQPERHHAFLDPRAASVVDADDRAAGLHRVVHHLDDLLAVDLAEAAAEHGEVLAEHGDWPAVHRAGAGDHAVAVGPVPRDPEVTGAVPGQLVELGERAGVEQQVDPLAGGQLAARVLFLDGRLRAGVDRFVPAALQIGELPRRSVRIGKLVGGAISGRGDQCGHRTRASGTWRMQRISLAAAAAEGNGSGAAAAAAQFQGEGEGKPRAAHADRMAEGHGVRALTTGGSGDGRGVGARRSRRLRRAPECGELSRGTGESGAECDGRAPAAAEVAVESERAVDAEPATSQGPYRH